MSSVTFTVAGEPAPQGSKTKWGTEDNPRTRPWRAAVAADATQAMNGHQPIHGPAQAIIRLYFNRPKHHYRTGRHAAELKPDAPRFHMKKPDSDKCARAILDSLTGIVVRDDSQIADLHVTKLYGTPHADITVRPLEETPIPATAPPQ